MENTVSGPGNVLFPVILGSRLKTPFLRIRLTVDKAEARRLKYKRALCIS